MATILRTAPRLLQRRHRARTGGRRGGIVRLAGGLALGLADMLDLWQRRLRDRDILFHMSTEQLKDIGLSRADALQEAEKPFWRP